MSLPALDTPVMLRIPDREARVGARDATTAPAGSTSSPTTRRARR